MPLKLRLLAAESQQAFLLKILILTLVYVLGALLFAGVLLLAFLRRPDDNSFYAMTVYET